MLKQLVTKPHNKKTISEIIHFIGNDPILFAELMAYFLGDNYRITQLTSWAIGHLGEREPNLFLPYHHDLLKQLHRDDRHNAIRRNIVRLYQFTEIPEEIEGELYDTCVSFILNPKEAIAVRAFSIKVCERIALKHEALIEELVAIVESTIPNGSSGLKNRAQHTITRLRKATFNSK